MNICFTSVCVPLGVTDKVLHIIYNPLSHTRLQDHRAEGSASPRESKGPPVSTHGCVHYRPPLFLLQGQFSCCKTWTAALNKHYMVQRHNGLLTLYMTRFMSGVPHRAVPSCRILKKICLSLPKAVKVTDSHGVPLFRSTICFSLVLSTLIHFLPYLQSTMDGVTSCTGDRADEYESL